MKKSPYETAHEKWLQYHSERRSGERLRRLQHGHAHGETSMLRQLWWPAFGHFLYLHPEYEVFDFFDGRRFLDFAYIRSFIRIGFEVDAFGTHYKKMTRGEFSDQWVRHTHLLNDDWIMVRIPYDDLTARPRLWQQLLQQLIGHLFGDGNPIMELTNVWEKEVIRLAIHLSRPIKLDDVQTHLSCNYRTARRHIRSLEEQQWLVPAAGGSSRVHAWMLVSKANRQMPRF